MPGAASRIGVALLVLSAGGAQAEDSAAAETAVPPTFTIRGTVAGSDGSPMDAFTLTVLRRGQEPLVHSLQDTGGRLDVELDGAFAGLVVNAEGHVAWPHSTTLIAVDGTYDIGPVRLQEERVVTGRVIDAGTGRPIARAQVGHVPWEMQFASIRDEDRLQTGSSATSDETGFFTLPGLPWQSVWLQAKAAGYAEDREVALLANRQDLVIRLGVGATVEGWLLLPGRVPASGTVSLSPSGSPLRGTRQQVDPQGPFRFEFVPPGSYRLGAYSAAGVAESRVVTVDHGGHVAIDVDLDPVGSVSGWISGLGETETASISVDRDDEDQRHFRNSQRRFGNGHFELHGLPDGAYLVKANAGERARIAKAIVVDGEANVDFDFAGRSHLAGVVLAGIRPLPRMNVRVLPDRSAQWVGWSMTDSAGRFEFPGLDDGEYVLQVRLGSRGSWRSFPVTVIQDTRFDVHLGPYSVSGRFPPTFRNHLVQARRVSAGDAERFVEFVDGSGRYRFDGLDEGDYVVSNSSPYLDGRREVRILGGSVEGVDIHPTLGETWEVFAVDADTKRELQSLSCEVKDGFWAGLSLDQDKQGRLRLPVNLIDAGLTCRTAGYAPASVRWDGGPLTIELARRTRQ